MLFIAINKLYSARSQCEHAGAESLFDCWVLSLELQQLIGAWSVDPGEHGGDRYVFLAFFRGLLREAPCGRGGGCPADLSPPVIITARLA